MLTEKQIDLFEEIENTKEKCLVMHCISFDKKMGAGIAKSLSRIIRKNIDCKACPGKHFKFI